jgi:hypothetical protein
MSRERSSRGLRAPGIPCGNAGSGQQENGWPKQAFLISVAFQPFFKIDLQLGMDLSPVLTMAGPFFRDINHGQIQHFQQGVIRWKYGLGFRYFPELTVKTLNRVGCVDQTAYRDYSGLLRATCPDFEIHHSGE